MCILSKEDKKNVNRTFNRFHSNIVEESTQMNRKKKDKIRSKVLLAKIVLYNMISASERREKPRDFVIFVALHRL